MSEPANMRQIASHLTPNTLRDIVIDLTGAINNPHLKGTEFAASQSVVLMRDFCVAYLDEQWPGWNQAENGKWIVDVPTPVVARIRQEAWQQMPLPPSE